ncbi:mas-related G-protein coupled receptor member X4-like [Urocitellus parryii]
MGSDPESFGTHTDSQKRLPGWNNLVIRAGLLPPQVPSTGQGLCDRHGHRGLVPGLAMPMKVLFIVVYYSNPSGESVWKFFPYLHLLSTINCSVNPIVYFVVGGLRRKKSRKSLKEALLNVFEEKPEPPSGGNAAPSSPTSRS